MICENCKVDRLVTDFINSQEFCYHCMYRIKLEKATGKRTPKPTVCRMCEKVIITKMNQKKRQRTVFCSPECAELGHKHLLKNHWTRKIRRTSP